MGYAIDGPYEVIGSNGTVTLNGEAVTIRTRSGEQTVRLRDIETVELRRADIFTRGYIRFRMTDSTRQRIRFPLARESDFTDLMAAIRTSLY